MFKFLVFVTLINLSLGFYVPLEFLSRTEVTPKAQSSKNIDDSYLNDRDNLVAKSLQNNAFLKVYRQARHLDKSSEVKTNKVEVVSINSNTVSTDLLNDFLDFVFLIDFRLYAEITIDYLDDPEIYNFLRFLMTAEFSKMIQDVEAMPEFSELITYFSKNGYDLTSAVNLLNKFLRIPPLNGSPNGLVSKPRKAREPRRQHGDRQSRIQDGRKKAAKMQQRREVLRDNNGHPPGITSLIEEYIFALPKDDIINLLREKIANKPEFAGFIKMFTSMDFVDILLRFMQNETFESTFAKLQEYGFDIVRIFEAILSIIF